MAECLRFEGRASENVKDQKTKMGLCTSQHWLDCGAVTINFPSLRALMHKTLFLAYVTCSWLAKDERKGILC